MHQKIDSIIEDALFGNPLIEDRLQPSKKLANEEYSFYGIIGRNKKLNEIFSLIKRISNSKATVFLRGESGTGKRLVARAIHHADRKRRNEPFVELSCGALSRGIIESELFGHTKGSFTDAISDRRGRFELAHGGTILLDDIDTLSLELQAKLLRVLQHKEFERLGDHKTIKVDVRIIVATNKDLVKAVAEERFREDLYYRLNVISIDILPLRERKDDIPLLVAHFIKLYAEENFKKVKGISKAALRILIDYSWPGNIRELENIIERAVILDSDSIITKDDFPEFILNARVFLHPELSFDDASGSISLKNNLKKQERVHILKALSEAGWNKKRASSKLGINRTTLYNKLRKYNLLS